jgi:hypothetical protein
MLSPFFMWVPFVQCVIFLYTNSSLILSDYLYKSSVLDLYVSGQLNSMCFAISSPKHKEQVPLSVPPLSPLSFHVPAFIHAKRHLLYLHYGDILL